MNEEYITTTTTINKACQELVDRFGIDSCIVESRRVYTLAYNDNFKQETAKLKSESAYNTCLKIVRNFACCFGAYEVYNGFLRIKYPNGIKFNQVTIMANFSYDNVIYVKTSEYMAISDAKIRLFQDNESVILVN